MVEFVEMPVFTEDLLELLPDDDYRNLQNTIGEDPERFPVVRGSHGLRKVRWGLENRGKSGGVRVLYFWAGHRGEVLMVAIFSKSDGENLTPDQLERLGRAAREAYQ